MSGKGRLSSTVGIHIVCRVNRSVLWGVAERGGALLVGESTALGSSHGFVPICVTLGESFHFSGSQVLPQSNTSAEKDDL